MFDNGSDPPKEKQSRGLLLDPNTSNRTVTLAKQFTNPTKTLLASSQGNLLNLSTGENTSGNWLMGYGGLPNFTEYDPSGHVLLDGTLGKNVQSFRTYLDPWSGQAPGVPAVAVSGSSVAVSWNGATNVASWQVPRWRLRDGARAGREGREGGLPDDDLGTGGQRLRRRAGARLQRRGARDLGTQSRISARPAVPARSASSDRARAVGLSRRDASGSRCSPRDARGRAGWERWNGSGASGNSAAARATAAADAGPPAPSCVPQTLNVSAALAGGRVTVSPGPGVRDASTAAQISFLGVPAADFLAVVVSGLAQWRARRQPARLLPGRRRELRAGEAVHARRARDGPCRARRSGQEHPVRVELHRRRARQPGGRET